MPLQTMTFTLSDFGWGNLVARAPRVWFRPTNPAVQGSRVMPDEPVQAVLTSTGFGTVSLATTHDLLPSGTGYTVTVDWLDSADAPDARPWAVFPQKIAVLPGFVSIGELIGAQVDNDMVYVAAGVVNPSVATGFRLDPVTGDLFQRVG